MNRWEKGVLIAACVVLSVPLALMIAVAAVTWFKIFALLVTS